MPLFQTSANITFTYYRDLAQAADFYGRILGFELVLDQDFAKVYQIAKGAFVGLVDGEKGTLKASETKPVMISIVTDDVVQWHTHLVAQGVPIFRPLKDHPALGLRGFMALDPEGYVLEFEQFMPTDKNARILELMREN